MELVDFLRMRLDEDETAAHEAAGWDRSGQERVAGVWHRDGINSVENSDGRLVIYGDGPTPNDGQVEHIARHDPARVLTDVEAKWRIVDAAVLTIDIYGSGPILDLAWETLRLLALPYDDHPDYREEWRPVISPASLKRHASDTHPPA